MNKEFILRLKETGKIIGIFILCVFVGFAWMYTVRHFQAHPLHVPKEVMKIIVWVFLIAICGMGLLLVGILLYGLLHLIKWLFVEPFGKDKTHGE